jgi:hypothetical protein
MFEAKDYHYICCRGHRWIKRGYGRLFNWTFCPKCRGIGTICWVRPWGH